MTTMRMGALDMMRANNRIISAMGPIDPPSVDEIAAAVHALAVAGGPETRFGLLPTPDSRVWSYDPDAFLHDVVELPPCSADDLPRILTQRARSTAAAHPLRVAVAGDYLIVDISHGLGDARLVNMLNQVLGERIDPARLPGWAHGRATRHPLRNAIAAFYGTQPRQAGRLMATRRGQHPIGQQSGVTVPWRREPVVVSTRSHEGTLARLRRRRDRLGACYSSASMLFAALADEIRCHGIDLHPSTTVMFDCRRYLRHPEHVYGNFVSGVELAIPDPGNPAHVHGAISDAARCGRPLATVLLGAQRFWRRYRSGLAYRDATSVARRPRAKLVFSDVGDVLADSPMWLGDSSQRFYNAINESNDPEAIVFTITHRGPDVDISATFQANIFAPNVIQSALDSAVREPERHLALKTGT